MAVRLSSRSVLSNSLVINYINWLLNNKRNNIKHLALFHNMLLYTYICLQMVSFRVNFLVTNKLLSFNPLGSFVLRVSKTTPTWKGLMLT